MRRIGFLMMVAQAALVVLFGVGLRWGWFPLGVPDDWEWLRLQVGPEGIALFLGFIGVILFSAFAAAGFLSLSRSNGPVREAFWLVGLVLLSIGVQAIAQEAAPTGYGLSKWIIALHSPGSSGYYTVAKRQMGNPSKFLADYPGWITRQDALHVGTHPPGLFVVAKGMMSLMEANPRLCRWVVRYSPPSVARAISAFGQSQNLPEPDAAGLALTGALTLIACALTVVPLYLLARSTMPASTAWASATLWPLVPAALMFQPAADTAFPFISTTALGLGCWAVRGGWRIGLVLGFMTGLTLAVGMFFTLAFLPVGLVVALVVASSPGLSLSRKVQVILAIGAGFLVGTLAWWGATSANPLTIWWVNQQNHGRFYVLYPRRYWAWLIENPLEMAVAVGLPSMIWAVVAMRWPGEIPRVTWSTLFVLAILTLSGKNLSEVARLWLPLMPPLLVASGWGFARVGGRAWMLGATIGLIGIQVLILEATIQVVYPF